LGPTRSKGGKKENCDLVRSRYSPQKKKNREEDY